MPLSPPRPAAQRPKVGEDLPTRIAALETQLSQTQAVVSWFTTGVSITAGNGAPTKQLKKGSLYIRLDGGVGTTLYVTQGGGVWNAVAGV